MQVYRCDSTVMWLDSLWVILLDGFSLRGNLLARLALVGCPYDTWLRQMDLHFAGGGDGPCGGLENGHQETEGVQLEGRCGNALPRRMLPLTHQLTDCWYWNSFVEIRRLNFMLP